MSFLGQMQQNYVLVEWKPILTIWHIVHVDVLQMIQQVSSHNNGTGFTADIFRWANVHVFGELCWVRMDE